MSNPQDTISPPIPSIEEAYTFFNSVPNPDGSLTRLKHLPSIPATPEMPDPDESTGIIALSKDIPLSPTNNTFIRLFLPRHRPNPATKLPIIIYFHGGGFVFHSATSSVFHDSCSRIAAHTPALVASVDYRLTPEHRLPAAYDDATDAVLWAKTQAIGGADADPWVREYGDFSSVFLMGSSSGGNIVYRVGLRALDLDLQPIKIAGMILNQPFFGGARRTESELKNINDRIIPLHASDLLWSLALPKGADRSHEYCDPFAGGGPPEDRIRRLPRVVVRGYAGDPMVDKQREFAKTMEARGGRVIGQFIEEGYHAVEVFDPKFAQALYDDIRDFVGSVCADDQAKL